MIRNSSDKRKLCELVLSSVHTEHRKFNISETQLDGQTNIEFEIEFTQTGTFLIFLPKQLEIGSDGVPQHLTIGVFG